MLLFVTTFVRVNKDNNKLSLLDKNEITPLILVLLFILLHKWEQFGESQAAFFFIRMFISRDAIGTVLLPGLIVLSWFYIFVPVLMIWLNSNYWTLWKSYSSSLACHSFRHTPSLNGNGSFRILQEILYHPPIFLMEIPGSLWEAREPF